MELVVQACITIRHCANDLVILNKVVFHIVSETVKTGCVCQCACVCVRLYVCVCQCACVSVRLTLNCLEEQRKIGDKQNLQDDIDKLVKWSEKWQMLFNFGKCKCLHTWPGNTDMNYEMGGTILSKTVKEKDLGVTMNANMKVSEQCRIAASTGNQVLGMIRRNITYKEKRLITPLYKAIVRPHLEYCIQAWSPYLRKYIDMLEKIQRRATKLIPGLRDLTYDERLKECGLTTLDTRSIRGIK